MYSRLLAVTLVFGFAGRSESQEVDAKKLCELIRTPRPSVMLGIGFNTQRGFVLSGESTDNSAEIAVIEKALCGDATDAERYYLLSELYEDADKVKQATALATKLFKKQLHENPRNGRLALRLGQCLRGENDDEAEKMLRQAVALSPKDAECWQEMGNFLWTKSLDEVMKSPDAKTASQLAALMNIVTRTISPENLRSSKKIANEASDCMDRAVKAAPRESKYYMSRAMASALKILLEEGSRPAAAEQNDVHATLSRLLKQFCEAKVVADIQKAAELEPTNPRAQLVAGVFEMVPQLGELLAKAKNDDPAAKELVVKEFKVQVARTADKLVVKLDALTTHKNKRTAAESCCFEGLLLFAREKLKNGDKLDAATMAKAERLLRRSVTLDPGNPSAWEILSMVLALQDKNKEEIAVCEARLRVKDNATNRYWAAKALVQLERYAEAEKHLRAGIASDPKSTINHVGLAAVLLRSGVPERRKEAKEQFDEADKLLEQDSNADLAENVAVLRAAHAALTGNPTAARQMLRAVLEKNQEHEVANKMLQILGQEKKRKA